MEAESVLALSTTPIKRVLVVDDDSQMRAFVRAALTPLNFELLEADGALEAMFIIQGLRSPIDLLITDIEMPMITGPELADFVRSSHSSRCPVLLMSGLGSYGPLHRYPLLTKPFSVSALLGKVSELLHGV